MKNIRIALIACMICLLAVACRKDDTRLHAYSADCFKVQIAPFNDESNSKAYLNYTESISRIIYESGDKILVNGHEYTLSYEDGEWLARGSAYSGEKFYAAYCDGTLGGWDSAASGPKYTFNANTNRTSSTHNKIILSGTSDNNYVLTLHPACAILRLNTGGAGSSWTNVRVGFDGNKIPKQGTINVATQEITPTTYMTGVSQGGGGVVYGDFMAMRYSQQSSAAGNHAEDEDDYWYVAIPIAGDQVSTTLYLGWNSGSGEVQRKTQGEVTLRKGYVYTLGTERQSPFYANGSSKSYFQVSPSLQVRFSAGNLQYTRYEDPGTGEMAGKWRFAEHQYDMMQDNNANIGNYYTGWIDLFGWGTSGWNSGGGAAYEPYATSGTFKPGGSNDADLLGTYANSDWGVYNSANIYYGSNPSGLTSWRTLTNDEWNYLLNSRSNAANKKGLATVGTAHGLVLLPESWTLPTGCSFTAGTGSGYSTNSYTLEQWDLMETAGAIFLPSDGYRNGIEVNETPGSGYYWSSTHNNGMYSYCLKFSATLIENTTMTRSRGCAVRLVKNR